MAIGSNLHKPYSPSPPVRPPSWTAVAAPRTSGCHAPSCKRAPSSINHSLTVLLVPRQASGRSRWPLTTTRCAGATSSRRSPTTCSQSTSGTPPAGRCGRPWRAHTNPTRPSGSCGWRSSSSARMRPLGSGLRARRGSSRRRIWISQALRRRIGDFLCAQEASGRG